MFKMKNASNLQSKSSALSLALMSAVAVLLAAGTSSQVLAAEEGKTCEAPKRQSQLVTKGVFVPPASTWGPSTDHCAEFGGDQISSAFYHINVIVSFNCPVVLDLDLIDMAFEAYAMPRDPMVRSSLANLSLVFVTPGKLKRLGGYADPVYATYSYLPTGEVLFISWKLIADGLLPKFLKDFYSGRCDMHDLSKLHFWPKEC